MQLVSFFECFVASEKDEMVLTFSMNDTIVW